MVLSRAFLGQGLEVLKGESWRGMVLARLVARMSRVSPWLDSARHRSGCRGRYVDRARQLLDKTFTTLVGESYKRAYGSMVMVQQLAELEEIMDVKT